jgi:hypothetical protein
MGGLPGGAGWGWGVALAGSLPASLRMAATAGGGVGDGACVITQ